MINLKLRLKQNKLTIGSWITLGSTSIAEIMAKGGFDWLAVDLEHSAITLEQAQQLIQIIELSGVIPLVRVGENDANLIKRVMDMGAYGVIVPVINSKNDAIKAVNAVKYPPLGSRGVGLARAQGYGMEFEKYKNWLNKHSIVIAQIEHIKAVENLRDILSVEGIDGFIVGPYDLSASLGKPGEFENSDIKRQFRRIIEVAKKMDKPSGFHVIPPDAVALLKKIREGYNFLGFSLDTLFLGQSIAAEMKKIKKELGRKR